MDDYDCIVCDNKMKQCIVWPFCMDYCNNCFAKKVSHVPGVPDDNFSKEDLINLLKGSSTQHESLLLRLPKLDKKALCNTWYFSIYSIELLLNKFNKKHGRSLCITNVENESESLVLTIENLWSTNSVRAL